MKQVSLSSSFHSKRFIRRVAWTNKRLKYFVSSYLGQRMTIKSNGMRIVIK